MFNITGNKYKCIDEKRRMNIKTKYIIHFKIVTCFNKPGRSFIQCRLSNLHGNEF